MEFAPLNGRTEFFCVWLPHLLGATENLWLANTMKVAADCQHQPRKFKLKKKKRCHTHAGPHALCRLTSTEEKPASAKAFLRSIATDD